MFRSIYEVKIEGKDAVANEGYYTINNVKKGNTYNATASVITEDWKTSIFFYFTVYTTTSNPVIQKPDPVKITFEEEVIESDGNSLI